MNGSVLAVGDTLPMTKSGIFESEIRLQYFPGDISSDQTIDSLFKYYIVDGEAATLIEAVRFIGDECARPSVGPSGLALEFLGLNESSVVFELEPFSQGPLTLGLYLRIVDSYSLDRFSTGIAQVSPRVS